MIKFLIDNLHIICSVLIAFLFSISQVLFGKYKLNHNLLIKRNKYLVFYGLYFSVICLITNILIFYNELKINSFSVLENKWATSIIVGLLIQAIAKMNFYSFKANGKEISIGPKLLNDVFEDFFEKKISDVIDEEILNEIKTMEKRLKKHTLAQIDILIKNCLPSSLSAIKRVSHMKEITNFDTKFDKLRYLAVKFGIERMRQIYIQIE
jgi:hypothetical protein